MNVSDECDGMDFTDVKPRGRDPVPVLRELQGLADQRSRRKCQMAHLLDCLRIHRTGGTGAFTPHLPLPCDVLHGQARVCHLASGAENRRSDESVQFVHDAVLQKARGQDRCSTGRREENRGKEFQAFKREGRSHRSELVPKNDSVHFIRTPNVNYSVVKC